MTSATVRNASSATKHQIAPFQVLKVLLVENNLLGHLLLCHPLFHPAYFGKSCCMFPQSHKYSPFSTMCRCFLSESCDFGLIMFQKPGSTHCTEISCCLCESNPLGFWIKKTHVTLTWDKDWRKLKCSFYQHWQDRLQYVLRIESTLLSRHW